MKRLLTHSQLKHTKQAANKFLTCFIATIMAVALSLPAAGIPTLSFADEPNQGSVTVTPADLEKGNSSSGSSNASGDTNLNKENNSSGDPKSALTAEGVVRTVLMMDQQAMILRMITAIEKTHSMGGMDTHIFLVKV